MVLYPKIELCCKLPTDLTTVTWSLTGSLSGFDQHVESALWLGPEHFPGIFHGVRY